MGYQHKSGKSICIVQKNRTLQAKSPVLKVFTGGLRLLPAACVALRAGTHNTETMAAAVPDDRVSAVVRAGAATARHGTEVTIVVPRAAAYFAVRTRRRTGIGGGTAYSARPVVTPFIHVSAHVVYAK